jgi:hypothetical protein
MNKLPYPHDVVAQALAAQEAWKSIDPALKVGTLAQADLATAINQAMPLQSQLEALEVKMTDLRNQRDDLNGKIWDMVKRLRVVVKGVYGDNSSQYEMVGGTRLSERKPAVRRKKVAA